MILNGKCKLDFYKFINKDIPDKESFECEMNINDLNYKSKTELNALIIEFFDSVGIIISLNYGFVSKSWLGNVNNKTITNFNSNRHQATEQAIIHANKIYNATKI